MVFSNGPATQTPPAPGSDSLFANVWLSVAAESASPATYEELRPLPSLSQPNERERREPKIQILLVEDNPADVLLVEEAIATYKLPVELSVADDGEKAIAFIEEAEQDQAAPCPEMLLLDLNLPKCSGLEVLRRVRQSERCKHVPVLILTSSDSPRDRAETAQLGADRYFKKPANYDEFLRVGEAVGDLLAKASRNRSTD